MALHATNDPDYLRNRAEEARAVAVQMTDPHTKAVMLSIAQDYEKLAQRAEQRAGSYGTPAPAAGLVPCEKITATLAFTLDK